MVYVFVIKSRVCRRGVMAVLTSPPYREDSVPQRLITLAEGLFEVVSHALSLRPPALPAMLPADAQSQSHFFDLWLTVAQIRCAVGSRAASGHPNLALQLACSSARCGLQDQSTSLTSIHQLFPTRL